MKLRESAKGRIRCGELGENRLINQLTARLKPRVDVIAGPGDDCAVVAAPDNGRLLLLKTDCVVERVHFRPNDKPSSVGWKAMAAAMERRRTVTVAGIGGGGLPRSRLPGAAACCRSSAPW